MSTRITKPTDEQALAWIKANPDATDEEVRAYVNGTPPSPTRFGTRGALGKAVALGRGAGQTLSFGVLDEAVGTLEALPRLVPGGESFGDAVGRNIAEERGVDKQVRDNNKGAYTVGEIAGAVGGGVGATRLAMSRGGALATLLMRGGSGGLGARVVASGAAGAAGAGATAFGQGEGNPIERLPATAGAAGIGGALGAAIPVAGAGLRAVGNATNIRPQFVNSGRESADAVNDALRRDKVTPDEILGKAKADPSVPITPLDAAGDNTRQLAKTAQARSNAARDKARTTLEGRAEAERDRYMTRLQEALNPKDKDIAETAAELRDIRRAHAEANFPAALEKSVTDVELARFFKEPEVRRAYVEHRENMLTRKAAGLDADVPPEIYAEGVSETGKRIFKLNTVEIPVKAFHVVQQAVNDVIDKGFKNGKTMSEDRAKALRDALARMHDKVEDAVPEYGAARKVYRDDSSAIDALQAGMGKVPKNSHGRKIPDFSKSSTDELKTWLEKKRAAAKMGDEVAAAEVENYLLGSYNFLRDQLNKRAGTGDWLSLPKTQQRIAQLMGGDLKKAQEFTSALKAEKRIKPTSSVSKAGTNIADDSDAVQMPALDLLLMGSAAATGRPYAMLASAGRLMRGEHFMSEKTATATMDRLFSGANSIEELTAGMAALKQAREAEVRRRARNLGTTAAVSAGATGAAVN